MDYLQIDFTDDCSEEIFRNVNDDIIWNLLKSNNKGWFEFVGSVTESLTAEQQKAAMTQWATDQFGEPGDRYLVHPNKFKAAYLFCDSKDYNWMTIRWH